MSLTLLAMTTSAQNLSLALDWYMNPNHAPLYAAQKYDIFKKHDLDIKIIAPSEGQTGPKMVAMGKIDLALSYQYHYHLFKKQGLPLNRIATLIPTPLNCLIVKADTDIKSPADLKGKKIGYHVGLGTSKKFINTLLRNVGLNIKDVKLIHAKNSLSASFLTGQLDAITGGYRTFEPAKMNARNVKIRIFNYEDYGVPAYEELIIVASQKRQNHAAFLKALQEGISYVKANSEKVLEDFIKDYPEQDAKITRQIWKATIPLFTSYPQQEHPELYKAFDEYLEKQE